MESFLSAPVSPPVANVQIGCKKEVIEKVEKKHAQSID